MKVTITNEHGEHIVTMDSSDRGPLTDDEIEMIQRMDDIVDEYDEDCPPMSDDLIMQMQHDIEERRRAVASNMAQMPVHARTGGGAVGVLA